MRLCQRTFMVAAAVLITGCRALGDTGDSVFGDQCTSNRAIYGCVDITGRVSNASDFPLENIDVGPAPGSNTHGLEAEFVNTGADGVYGLRLFQLDPNGPALFQLSIKATQRDNAGVQVKSKTMIVDVAPFPLDDYPDPVILNLVIQ